MTRWGIESVIQQAAFLAQISHESGRLARWEENLNYSAQRLMQIWPRRFPSLTIAQQYAGKPEALANFVYGGRMGNTQPGDGWRYRGRGLKQLTGKDNYTAYMLAADVNALSNPDLLLEPKFAADSAGWFWAANGLNALADARAWPTMTRRINGGLIGLADRVQAIQRAIKALESA